jgi:hypothetical protein
VLKIIWTEEAWSAPDVGTRLVDSETRAGAVHIPPGGARSVQAFFVDENLNPLAANDSARDNVTFAVTRARLDGALETALRAPERAMTFAMDPLITTRLRIRDDRGAILDFPGRNCDAVSSAATGLCFARILRDNDPARSTPGAAGTVRATLRYTPLPARAAKVIGTRPEQRTVVVGDIPVTLDVAP